MELIASPLLPADEHEIVLHNDGTWDPLPPKVGLPSWNIYKQTLVHNFSFVDSRPSAHAPGRTPPCLLLP